MSGSSGGLSPSPFRLIRSGQSSPASVLWHDALRKADGRTISNPNTSEAAKDHAREVLDQIAEDSAPPDHASVSAHIVPEHVEHENRVLGGYKA